MQWLWVQGCYNRCWVIDILQKMESASKGKQKAKSQDLRENTGWEMRSLEEALSFLETVPGPVSIEKLSCVLQMCRKRKNLACAHRVYAYMCKIGLEAHSSLGNYFVPMLVESGSIRDAHQVFNRLVHQNEYSWTSLITGYIECGESQHALNLHQKMQRDGVQPSGYTFVALLKACTMLLNVERGREIHAEIARKGLERDIFVGNTLVNMYAKCGLLAKAREVFDKLPVRDAVSWNALMVGYIENGCGVEALNCFEQMPLEGISPDALTFVCILKACGIMGAIDKGQVMHGEIVRNGLFGSDLFVGSALVDMYVKCGLLAKARQVFDDLRIRNIVSWNALIAGYAEQGLGEDALNCLECMQLEGVSLDARTSVCSLKACGSIGAIDKGQEIHAEITRKGWLERDPYIGNALVDMYARCGLLAEAQEVFDKLPVRNVVSWNTLIAGYAKHGLGEEALNCVEQMQLEGVTPDALTLVSSLKACGSIQAIEKGQELHGEIAKKGSLEMDPFVGNALIDMYAKCGMLAKARELFDRLLARDVVSWTALIAANAEYGLGEEALKCFEQMQLEGVSPNPITFVCVLKACGSIGAVDKGQEIHNDISRKGLLEKDPFVCSALIDMYAKCGLLAKAEEVFQKLQVQDAVSWNALIAGYAEHGFGEKALYCLGQMQVNGVSPNAVTYVSSLKVCGAIGATDKGRELHAQIARKGLDRDTCVGNSLVDMYAKCGMLAKARNVFDKLPVRDVVSWTALITGYSEHGFGEEALNCYKQMQLDGVSPNAVTFVCSLKACGSIGASDKIQEIHADIARKGLLERDPCVGNTLVDVYAKCGLLARAQDVFDKLPVRDVVSWTALITGYAKYGLSEEALVFFEWMQLEGVSPDTLTFVCSLKACGSVGATHKGQELHAEIVRKGLFERDTCVGNTLVDMYAKCGSLAKAQEVFNKLPVRDVVSWSALISGYCYLGESEIVFYMLERMRGDGIKPNRVTLLSVLALCSHTGLVEKGQKYFEAMSKDYGISPTIEHHTCMVDLLGRAGQLYEAVGIMKKMPFCPDLVTWHTVLSSCRKWGNVELGRRAFEHIVQLNEKDASAYVSMSNIYADAQMYKDEKEH